MDIDKYIQYSHYDTVKSLPNTHITSNSPAVSDIYGVYFVSSKVEIGSTIVAAVQ